MRKWNAAAALGLLAMFGAAQAEEATVEQTDRFTLASSDYVSVLGGYALPDTDRGTKRRGLNFGLIYGNQFSEHFAVEGHAQASIFDTGKHAGTDFYQWGGTVDLVYGFNDRRTAGFTPFVLAGIGAVRNDVADNIGLKDKTSFLANAGLGFVTKPLLYNIRMRAEGRYAYDTFDGGKHDFVASLGIELPLGRVHDHVTVIKEPDRVEIRTVDKIVERLIVDSDGDTVEDAQDQCPDTPKGLKVDAQGCILPGQIVELRGIVFDPNTARLQPNAQSVLDLAIKTMVGQKSLVVELGGHIDGREKNKALGLARAEAARSYMISKGVSAENLTVKDYGHTKPKVRVEKSDIDRELNRRVDFHVVVK